MRLVPRGSACKNGRSTHDLSSGGPPRSAPRECGHARRARRWWRWPAVLLARATLGCDAGRHARPGRSRPARAASRRSGGRSTRAVAGRSPRDGAAVEAAAAGAAEAVPHALRPRRRRACRDDPPLAALTVYGAEGMPLAWEGRPASLPASRLAGGRRLVPGADAARPAPGAARAGLPASTAAGAAWAPSWPRRPCRRRRGAGCVGAARCDCGTPLAPVLLRPERAARRPIPTPFDVARQRRPAARHGARVGRSDIDGGARALVGPRRRRCCGRWRRSGWCCSGGPLADWRATARTRGPYPGVSALATGARGLAAWGVPRPGARRRRLSPAPSYSASWRRRCSPLRSRRSRGHGRPLARSPRRARRHGAAAARRAALGPCIAAGSAPASARWRRTTTSSSARVLPAAGVEAARVALTPLDLGAPGARPPARCCCTPRPSRAAGGRGAWRHCSAAPAAACAAAHGASPSSPAAPSPAWPSWQSRPACRRSGPAAADRWRCCWRWARRRDRARARPAARDAAGAAAGAASAALAAAVAGGSIRRWPAWPRADTRGGIERDLAAAGRQPAARPAALPARGARPRSTRCAGMADLVAAVEPVGDRPGAGRRRVPRLVADRRCRAGGSPRRSSSTTRPAGWSAASR